MKNAIEISYDGKFPNLCMGNLIVTIDGIVWKFPACCLKSGGTAYMHEGTSITTNGEWYIRYWPDNFPEELKQSVLEKINKVIPEGCCGGCI